jgi:hypothetical protein
MKQVIHVAVCSIFVFSFLLTGCSAGSSAENEAGQSIDPDNPPVTSGSWYKPPVSASWQWQLSGTINTAYDVDIYDLDLFDSTAALIQKLQASGKKVVCYFSAGSYENWRSDEASFNSGDLGNNHRWMAR